MIYLCMKVDVVSLGIEAECWLIFWRLLTEVLMTGPLRGVCWVWPFSWWNWLSSTRLTSVIHVSLTSRDGACKTQTSCRPGNNQLKRNLKNELLLNLSVHATFIRDLPWSHNSNLRASLPFPLWTVSVSPTSDIWDNNIKYLYFFLYESKY